MRVDFPDRPRRRAGEEFTVVMNLLRGRVGTPEPEPAPEAAPVASRPGLLVQGVSPRGRTTLVADRLEGTAIVGDNPAFGPSRIEVTAVDKLLLGRAVGAGDEQLPFDKWRLRLAPLPRALRE
jgi:hypothetical protein